ncbi:MAG: glycosyltransferase family 9 protein, partial [Cytophagaceae bacterium]|nr:glycosyltransferase family 9 protein [Gemmatimonadaceae bacterium]
MPASLIIQTSFLGDAVLTTPLVAELAARGPVTLVVTKAAAPLFANHPGVSRLVVYDKRGADAGVSGFTRMTRELRAPDTDAVAYLAQGSHRSGALSRAAGYKERVGFATSAGRLWYTNIVDVTPGMHHAERLWRLAGSDLTPSTTHLRPRLFPSVADEALVDALLRENDATGEPLIALAPGSVWTTKQWPYYAQLARDVAALGRIVIVGGPADAALAREISSEIMGGAID